MHLKVRFHPPDEFKVRFEPSEQNIPIKFKQFQQITVKPDVELYEGEYNITPDVEAQIIPTANKFLSEDVTVKQIPFFNVGNTAGGSTVYIATMDEDPSGAVAILGRSKLGAMLL